VNLVELAAFSLWPMARTPRNLFQARMQASIVAEAASADQHRSDGVGSPGMTLALLAFVQG
jgi:hypothetical protein